MGKSARRSPRRFLERGRTPGDFLRDLDAARCRYVVLRWFDDLPRLEPGEDIDILVHNEDVEKVRAVLRPRPLAAKILGSKGLIRCDVYSVSGLPGSSYQGIAYYPPHLAQGILERAVRHPSGAMVPSGRDYFYSLAFHALYHKGLRSGLPVSTQDLQREPGPEHDYEAILRRLADLAGIAVEIEMNALDDELARAGWRPPIDFMERVLPSDPWIQSLVLADRRAHPTVNGLAVFILRERAIDRADAIDAICDLLREDGFNILAVNVLSGAHQARCEHEIRGGNWGRGPWATSGGRPAVAIAALDVFPATPGKRLGEHHPRADNERVFASKDRIRNWANEALPVPDKCNVVHSSDNAAEAASHIDLLFPDAREKIFDAAARLLASVDLPGEVVRRLDRNGRRAIVEIIRREDGSLAVRKRFRPEKEAYFRRELSALSALGRICPDVVPEVLEYGENYVVMPYYTDMRRRLGGRLELPIPVPALRKAFLAAKSMFDHGYALVDFRPHNLIIQRNHQIKIIDFEETQERCPDERPSDFSDLEVFEPDEFDRAWGRAAGLPLHSLLYDPLWMLHLKRWTFGYLTAGTSTLRKVQRGIVRKIDRRRERMALRRARRRANALTAGSVRDHQTAGTPQTAETMP
jgi:hypothetical protein